MTAENSKHKTSIFGRIVVIAILLFGFVLGAVFAFVGISYLGIRPLLIREYGTGIPQISEFVPNQPASYIDTLAQKPELGIHPVQIEVNGSVKTVWLWVRDTVAPYALPMERTISTKTVLKPDELIAGLTDASGVWVDFAAKPSFGVVGDYPVSIVLTDLAGNQAYVDSLLHIRVLRDEGVQREAGTPIPEPREFLSDDYAAEFVTEITEEMMRTPGTYSIQLNVEGEGLESKLTIQDTQPPIVRTCTLVRAPGTMISPALALKVIFSSTLSPS